MINENIRAYIAEKNPNIIILDNPSYDNSILGIDIDDRIVYDYDKMICELMKDNDLSMEDAIDFCEYNTLRALSYIDQKSRPIVLFYKNDITELCK